MVVKISALGGYFEAARASHECRGHYADIERLVQSSLHLIFSESYLSFVCVCNSISVEKWSNRKLVSGGSFADYCRFRVLMSPYVKNQCTYRKASVRWGFANYCRSGMYIMH